jgi:glycine cleavage system aminomethyltransferase T
MTLQDHHRIIREGAAIGAVSPRRQIAVVGKDRAAYLQGLLTNDIEALRPGTGCYAAWLTPQGRMLTDMHVLESDSMMLLDVPADTVDATLARLEQFHLHGRCARGVASGKLVRVVGARPAGGGDDRDGGWGWWGSRSVARLPARTIRVPCNPITVVRIDQIGVPGYCVYLEREHEAAYLTALESAGAVVVLPAAIEAARIEAGYPVLAST